MRPATRSNVTRSGSTIFKGYVRNIADWLVARRDARSASAARERTRPDGRADVADAHTRRRGPVVRHAWYARLVAETDRLFRSHRRWRSSSRCAERPYDVPRSSSVRCGATACSRSPAWRGNRTTHPVMGCEVGGAYDRFRAVHDVLGHGYLGVGFDRDGEYTTWRFQERFHSPLARRSARHRAAR